MIPFDEEFVEAFYQEYAQREKQYEMALARVSDALTAAVSDHQSYSAADQRRVRVERGRVKEANRLLVKAQQAKYEGLIQYPPDIFRVITDIAGTRITCNTYEDVRRVEATIASSVTLPYYSGVPQNKAHEDYLESPKPSGYRALHLLVQVEVPVGSSYTALPVEIQIRTLLQHAWGELTHEDTFKPEVRVPPLVGVLSKRLATALAVLDEIAQDLRDELNKIEKEPDTPEPEAERDASTPKPRKPALSQGTIRHAFEEVYGRVLSLNANELSRISQDLTSAEILSRDVLETLLKTIKEAEKEAYARHMTYLSDFEIFESIADAEGRLDQISTVVEQTLSRRLAEMERHAAFADKYPIGSIHMATTLRVTPRYAIVQLVGGAQAIVSARHLEEGRRRVQLDEHIAPGESLRVEVVNNDADSMRIEARPLLPPGVSL